MRLLPLWSFPFLVWLTGCATTQPASEAALESSGDFAGAAATRAATADAASPVIPVTRHGRYTLVELMPEPVQRDLMRQIVEVSMPPALDMSVGDALRHVLRRSGYRLCETGEAATLYALPLPAAHLHLGPLMLRHALSTLAGPVWELSVDDVSRTVCFQPRGAADVVREPAKPMEPANPPNPAAPRPEAAP
jgi:type IV pili sensor histidine kinase/response regulator